MLDVFLVPVRTLGTLYLQASKQPASKRTGRSLPRFGIDYRSLRHDSESSFDSFMMVGAYSQVGFCSRGDGRPAAISSSISTSLQIRHYDSAWIYAKLKRENYLRSIFVPERKADRSQPG